MSEFHLMHWMAVFAAIGIMATIWGYPLSILCRRAGKSPSIGWIAGSFGLFFCGPLLCAWWLALSRWNPPQARP